MQRFDTATSADLEKKRKEVGKKKNTCCNRVNKAINISPAASLVSLLDFLM